MSNNSFYGVGDSNRQQLNDELNALENKLREKKNPPRYLTPWFVNTQKFKDEKKAEKAKKENYSAYNSIKFANSIGKDLGKLDTDSSTSEDETIGIDYLNKKVKDFNSSLKESKSLLKKVNVPKSLQELINNTRSLKALSRDDWKLVNIDVNGAWGEKQVQKKLGRFTLQGDFLLTDVLIPYNDNKFVQIDALYITKKGIYVLEVKTYKIDKNVGISTSGHLVVDGEEKRHDPNNSLKDQVNMHERILSNFLEKYVLLETDAKKIPIVNVVVLVNSNGNEDYSIETKGFETFGFMVTNVTLLYDKIIKPSNDVLSEDEVNAIYSKFKEKSSFNKDGRPHRKNISGKKYHHTLFFKRADWSGRPNSRVAIENNLASREDVKRAFETYVIERTRELDELNTVLHNLDPQEIKKVPIKNPYESISKINAIKSNPVNNTTNQQKPVANTSSTPTKQQTIHKPSQRSLYKDRNSLLYTGTSYQQEKSNNSKSKTAEGFYERNKFLLWPIVSTIALAILLMSFASMRKTISSNSSSETSSSSSETTTSSRSSDESSETTSSSSSSDEKNSKDQKIRKLFAGKIYSYTFSASYDTAALNGKDLDGTLNLESIDMRDDAPYYLIFSKDNDEVVVSENKVDAIKYQNSKKEFENAYKEQTKTGKQYYKVANHGLSVYLQNIVFVDDNHANSNEVKFTQSGIDAVNAMINRPVKDGYVRTTDSSIFSTNDYSWEVKQSLGPEDFDSTDTYSAYIKYHISLSEFDPD